MSGAATYREITIPGFILEDPGLSDGAKILYGKITRLAYRDGYCWASNRYIDDQTSARTVRRNLKQLEEAGYIVLTAKGMGRKIELAKNPRAEREERVKKRASFFGVLAALFIGIIQPETSKTPPDKSVRPPDKSVRPPDKSVRRTSKENIQNKHENLNNKKTNKKTEEGFFVSDFQEPDFQEPEGPPVSGFRGAVFLDFQKQGGKESPGIPPGKPIENRADATTVWNMAREYWNARKLKPECREVFIRPSDTSEILAVFGCYSWDDIKNAIGNYAWHLEAGPEYRPPAPYGSLAGFLKTGVARYCKDEDVGPQFKIKRG